MQKFIWKVLCLENKIGISLDQKLIDKTSPITEYFFWPNSDAWEDLRKVLESTKWISPNDRIHMLNVLTDLINSFDKKGSFNQKDLPFLQKEFPNIIFVFVL